MKTIHPTPVTHDSPASLNATERKVYDELLALTIADKYGEWNSAKKDFDPLARGPMVILRDNRLIVSAEDGGYFADYYGEGHGGYAWVHPDLEALAKKHGGFWEWENPGCIYFCE